MLLGEGETIVDGAGGSAVPLSGIDCCVLAGAFKLLSINISDSAKGPAAVGTKLTGRSQAVPAASVPGFADSPVTSGQSESAKLFNEKS